MHVGVLPRCNSSGSNAHPVSTPLGNWNTANVLTMASKARSIPESHCLDLHVHVDPDADPWQNSCSTSHRQQCLHYIWKLRFFFQTLKLLRCPGTMKSHKTSKPADVHKTCEPQVCLLWLQTVACKTLKGLPPTHHLYQTASYFPITSEYVSQKVSQNLPLCLL